MRIWRKEAWGEGGGVKELLEIEAELEVVGRGNYDSGSKKRIGYKTRLILP